MPMDETDKKLVNGLIWIAVVILLAYFIPSYGYGTKSEEAAQALKNLEESSKKYMRYYTPMQRVHFGDYHTTSTAEAPPGYYLDDLMKAYKDSNADSLVELDKKETTGRFAFPEWTLVPENERLNPGVYFHQMWQRKRNQVSTRLVEARVNSDDPNVGFSKWEGNVDFTVNKTEERLRELAIAEKILNLCIEAKLRQEQFERGANLQPEAFMRVIKVEPQDSRPVGPTRLTPNPAYSEQEKNPNSPRFNKFLIKSYKPFIQEYPVSFELQCDINTFMRFLHSVRRHGQFLVIRNLQIVSPALDESLEDKTEISKFKGDGSEKSNKAQVRDEHVFVTMSAAGMDFFDPVANPRGLYETKPTTPTKGPTRTKKSMTGSTATGQNNTPP